MSKHIDHKVNFTPCKANKHLWMPISWRISTSSKTASEFACSHCLMTIEKRDIEVICCEHNKQICEEIEKKGKSKEE